MMMMGGSPLWWLAFLISLHGPTTHAYDPPDTPTIHAHHPSVSPNHHINAHFKNPESLEAQMAVLEVMREDCEVKMREERRFLKQMRTGEMVRDTNEGIDAAYDDAEEYRVVENNTKPRTRTSDERTENIDDAKENEITGRENENQINIENGIQVIRENGNQGIRKNGNQGIRKNGNQSLKEIGKQVVRENGNQSLKEDGSVVAYCPTTFDDVYCWPRTPPDTLSQASRYCTSQGTWFRLDGGNSSWTNYTLCSPTYVVAESVNMTLYRFIS
ncbi:Calcitonin receptor-like 2, partial [Homarus americanus]